MDDYNGLELQKQKCYAAVMRLEAPGIVLDALKCAERWHSGQFRNDVNSTPYIIHIYRTVRILIEKLGVKDSEVLAAGALHDTMEDCKISEAELKMRFGDRIATIVEEETNDKSRYPSKESYLVHLRTAPIETRMIKLADRIDNLRSDKYASARSEEHIAHYIEESKEYVLPLAKSISPAAYTMLEKLINRLGG